MRHREPLGYGKNHVLMLLVAMIALAGLACSGSQQPTQTGASTVSSQAYSAMAQADWEAYSGLLHPDAAAEFKATIMKPINASFPPDSAVTEADTITILGRPFPVLALREMEAQTFFHIILKTVFESVPQLQSTFLTMQGDVIGEVKESEDIVHVVARTTMNIGGADVSEMNVMTAEKYAGDWKIHLSTKTRGLAQLVQQALSQRMG